MVSITKNKSRETEEFEDIVFESNIVSRRNNCKIELDETDFCEHVKRYDDQRGEYYCLNCGLVFEDRTIEPVLSMHQMIGRDDSNYSTSKTKKCTELNLRRALKRGRRCTYEEKRIIMGVYEINRLCSKLELPNQICIHSEQMFKKIINRMRNHYIILVASLCVYYVAKHNRVPVELSSLVKKDFSQKLSRKYYREILEMEEHSAPKSSATIFIAKTCSELDLPADVKMLVYKLVHLYEKKKPCNSNSHKGIVGGCIYFACKMKDINRTQLEISNNLEISELTLRSRVKEIKTLCSFFKII